MTILLQRWESGDAEVVDALAPLVYDHLRNIAARYLSRERSDVTIQATGLVNELFLRLLRIEKVKLESRDHFYSFAARMMRRILVDSARARMTAKRNTPRDAMCLSPDFAWIDPRHSQMIDLDHALDRLAAEDARKARIVELRVFLGCTAEEAASLMGISKPTVDREMRYAVAWLYQELRPE